MVTGASKEQDRMSSNPTSGDLGATVTVPPEAASRISWRKFAGFSVVIVLLLGGFLIMTLTGQWMGNVSGEAIAAYIKCWGIWGHFGLVGLMVVHSFVPFPAEFAAIAAGMTFGAVWGTVLTWTGAMAGALLAFGLSRRLGRPFIADILTARQMARIDDRAAATGLTALIVVRLIPVIAFNLVNYAAGLTNVTWWRFTWTTAIGILPLTALMAVMGEQMREPTPFDWAMFIISGFLLLTIVHLTRRKTGA